MRPHTSSGKAGKWRCLGAAHGLNKNASGRILGYIVKKCLKMTKNRFGTLIVGMPPETLFNLP
jgi:hypothetical protein